jgi:hypothetical protein
VLDYGHSQRPQEGFVARLMAVMPSILRLRWLLLPAAAVAMLPGDSARRPAPADTHAPPGIRFVRERIRVGIRPAGIGVEGVYVFRNELPEPATVPLFYPFPVDSIHPWPTWIVVCSQEGDDLSFSRPRFDGILFRVTLPADGIAAVRVAYEQPSLDHSGCYILTTTSEWGRPLETAEFEVAVPVGINLETMAYDADELVRERGVQVYRFTRHRFMPTRNLCVRWSVRSPVGVRLPKGRLTATGERDIVP